MDIKAQQRAPIYEALDRFGKMRVVPFDVPGHKRGRGNPELVRLLGEKCVGMDVNSMKPLDNLCHPVSVIRDAEKLAADAFGAENAFARRRKSRRTHTRPRLFCRAGGGDAAVFPSQAKNAP